MSELERELELEMDDESSFEAFEFGEDSELEDYENDFGLEAGDEDEADEQFEWPTPNESDYAERFYELSQQDFEAEMQIDEALGEILDDMQKEYFSFGGIIKKAKGLGNVVNRGISLAKKAGINLPAMDALKSMLGPAAEMLKSNWKTVLKTAIAAHPAGAAALPALKALGFESSEDMVENRGAWDDYVSAARESFEYLVNNATVNVNNPVEANRLAANAFQAGLKNLQAGSGNQPGGRRPQKVRRIYLSPGEVLVVKHRR